MIEKYFVPEIIDCSFCGKSQAEAKKIVAGPNIYVCDECVCGFLRSSEEATLADGDSESCDFCHKQAREVKKVFQRESARICNECLEICREIVSFEPETAAA